MRAVTRFRRTILRFYGLVQFLPFVLIPLMLVMYTAPRHFVFFMVVLALLYSLAKLFELFDHQIYQALGGVVGGHALKHLTGPVASACLLIMLYRRGKSGRAYWHGRRSRAAVS